MAIKIREAINDYYQKVRPALGSLVPWVLILIVILGASHRAAVLKENFQIIGGPGVFLSMAAHLGHALGAYSDQEASLAIEKPKEFVYDPGNTKYKAKSVINNEIGWSFILRLILPSGIKGMQNIALEVVRHQILVDLLVVLFLFFVGRALVGNLGGLLAALGWATFKMPMVFASWFVYYYWPIPFSALCMVIWACLFRPEDKDTSYWTNLAAVFFFGLVTGLATWVRLHFLLLPLVYAPFILIRAGFNKKGLLLLLVFFAGHMLLVTPTLFWNKHYHGRYAITTRGAWHGALSGLGAYPNPWGIINTGEVHLNEWVQARGGPDLNKVGIKAWDDWCRAKLFQFMKERPDIFWRNFKSNFRYGLTITPHYFKFFGIFPDDRLIKATYPWLVLSALALLFFLSRRLFWITAGIALQGLYFLLVVVAYFINYSPWMAGYIPVFAFLLFASLAIWLKFLYACGRALYTVYVAKTADYRKLVQITREQFVHQWPWLGPKVPIEAASSAP